MWGLSLSEWMASVLIPELSALIWKEGSEWAYPRHTCCCDSCDSCQAQEPQTNTNHTTACLWNSHYPFRGNHQCTPNERGTNVMVSDYSAWWCEDCVWTNWRCFIIRHTNISGFYKWNDAWLWALLCFKVWLCLFTSGGRFTTYLLMKTIHITGVD